MNLHWIAILRSQDRKTRIGGRWCRWLAGKNKGSLSLWVYPTHIILLWNPFLWLTLRSPRLYILDKNTLFCPYRLSNFTQDRMIQKKCVKSHENQYPTGICRLSVNCFSLQKPNCYWLSTWRSFKIGTALEFSIESVVSIKFFVFLQSWELICTCEVALLLILLLGFLLQLQCFFNLGFGDRRRRIFLFWRLFGLIGE